MEKIINVALPEWAWLAGGEHEAGGDPLKGRNVVLHVRSATVLEFFEEDNFVPNDGVKTHKFTYTNAYGIAERHIAVLHYSADCHDAGELSDILEGAARWYSEYMRWEDDNIALGQRAALN